MGGVGTRLRDERERRGIGIDQIEAETRIRAKFLVALEEERFDVLPGPAYVRAFVRDYAERLGLDPQAFVDDLNSRPDLAEDVVMVPPRQIEVPPLLGPRTRAAAWAGGVVAAILILAVAVFAVGALRSSGGGATPPPGRGTTAHTTAPASGGHSTPGSTATTTSPPASTPSVAPLQLAATGGDVWLSVRVGSSSGRVLYENTLPAGRHLRFAHRRRLWVRVGAPWNLTVSAGRRQLSVPLTTIGDMVVTAAGVRPAA